MGFFADVGPMQIFVSIHLIPPDLKFFPDANPPNFSNDEQIIERGAMVRIKIMGLRMDVRDIVIPPVPLLHTFNYILRCPLFLLYPSLSSAVSRSNE
jgi:DNA-directed RNA polymerase subunit E'/Rpb7